MSSSTSSSPESSEQLLLLRWSEAPNRPSREEFVQLIEAHLSQAVIRSALKLTEETKVYLLGQKYKGNGIVRSCRRQGDHFILTIWIGNENPLGAPASEIDPGVLAVEDFLTEEQERKILEDFDTEMRFRVFSSWCAAT